MTPTMKAGLRQQFNVFLMKVFQELHPGEPPLANCWYLRAICHALTQAGDRPGARLVITVPPRHLKSVAAAVAWPAFLLGHDPTRRILIATYSEELARQHARGVRQIMQTAWYRELFPHTHIAEHGNRLLEIITTAGGGRRAVSVGGSVTGFGADIIIVDDCMKAEDARSNARREEVLAWFDGTLATRLNDAGGGVIVSISQRLHEMDLPAHMLARGYDHLCLPAIAERDEFIAIGEGQRHHRQVGDILDRPGLTREALETLRRNLGSQVFSAQYQQNPTAPEGNLIRLEWFGTYYELIKPERFHPIIQSWDTGMSDARNADYSVCTTWGYLDGKWHLIDVLRQQLAFPDLKRAVLSQNHAWKPDYILIEDAGSGKSLWQEFRASRALRPIMIPASISKEERVVGITAQLEAGLCVLPAEATWLDAFLKECRAFPFAQHDDQVDSLSQFVEFLLSRRGRSALVPRDPVTGRQLYTTRPDAVHRQEKVRRSDD